MAASYAERLRGALAEQHARCFDPDARTLKPEYAEFIDCPVCESSDGEPFLEKDWFKFPRCRQCGMVYLNPRLNEKATYAFYNSEWNAIYNETKFDSVSNPTILDDEINAENLATITEAAGTRRGRLLEIGCGNGFFLKAAKAAGFDVLGLELNEKNCVRIRGEIGNDAVLNTDLFDAKLPDDTFDVLYMRDVFEHVPNPRAMLRELHRIARPAAILFIEVPNIEGLVYKLVRQRHVCVFGFEHLNYWSPATLKTVLDITGFDVRRNIHASLDFTLKGVFRSFVTREFTTLYPIPAPPLLGSLSSLLYQAIERLPPLAHADAKLTPALANKLGRGSVIKVLAVSRS